MRVRASLFLQIRFLPDFHSQLYAYGEINSQLPKTRSSVRSRGGWVEKARLNEPMSWLLSPLIGDLSSNASSLGFFFLPPPLSKSGKRLSI